MKNIFKVLIFLSLIVIIFSFINPPKKTKVLFFGDSITERGIQPTGYITKIDSIIKQKKNVRIY